MKGLKPTQIFGLFLFWIVQPLEKSLVTDNMPQRNRPIIELVRVSSSFLACRSGSAKYETCFIFQQPSSTLDPDLGPPHLETGMS